MDDFSEFWARYPRKIGKLYAQKCYTKARKQATAEDILAGLDRYIASKPAWQQWAHPSSWLNAGRWMDEVETVPVQQAKDYIWPCPHGEYHSETVCRTQQILARARAERGA